jgi:integrase/recombinase XerD
MLCDLLPQSYPEHLSLPLLGSVLDEFDEWLVAQGYRFNSRQCYVLRCTAIEAYFHRRKQHSLAALTSKSLQRCWQYHRRRPGGISAVVRCLQRFLRDQQILPAPEPSADGPFVATLDAYRQYLLDVRGLAPTTIDQHGVTACQLLLHQLAMDHAFRLADLTQARIERFVTDAGKRYGRGTLQHVVAQIRGLLRFLAMRGEAPVGLDRQIDTPRVYRLEQLPRALQWDTVCALLESIDRTSAGGLRDYAMFLLIATYGLRGCDVAGLTLDDIDWRSGELHVRQSKTSQPLSLPLTDPVAEALLAYLRDARPPVAFRQVFITVQAPILPIKRQTVGYAFRYLVKRSGLDIRYRGVHCLRHSYALHLLRQGVSLKTIGDLLGHRSTQSTCVYLRLDLDDLREVALPLPGETAS